MFKSQRIALAPLTDGDLPLLFQWINERGEVLLNAPYKPVHERQHAEWFDSIRKRGDVVILGIRLLETDKLIGTCQLRNIDHVHRIAELQIRIGDTSERGHGYGEEAVRLLLAHGFRDLNLRRVWLQVFATNARALRTYEKAGFVREGVLRQAAHIDGSYVDVVIMGMLREEHGAG
jgi:RimJ/RimL family protein N-acetyltransferase